MEEKKQSSNFFISLFKWKMDEEELKNQVENYNNLGFSKSTRKVAAALLILSILITLVFVLLGLFNLEDFLIDIIILAVLAIFVYRGSKIAIILAMIYWTFAKGYQVITTPNYALMAIIFWAIYMSVFWQAYQVEEARKDLKKEKMGIDPKIKKSPVNYCPNCGIEIEEDSRFCTKCGKKISIS